MRSSLIYQTGDFITLETFQVKGGADLFQATKSLETGLYCIQGSLHNDLVFWCFKITSPSSES